ncbi:YdeI/OmpD-associated family protein [Salinimicrobium sp. GXAS 041]|uniref:YdeI/OmpD-associated family protein n=1 Tax=Salinimicrobium sp. GXAS 041 TaxID=3400806 RepID=UPI003C74F935
MAVSSVEAYIIKHQKWQKQLEILRDLLLSEGLEETIKWGAPVYMHNNKNVMNLAAFKNHFALWFFKGALLAENTELLQNAQEGKTQFMRQIRFENNQEVDVKKIRPYILEAIQNEKNGKEIKSVPKAKKAEIPAELKAVFDDQEDVRKAFEQLSPGKQKEYALYISEAKREATKKNRLDKIIPMILEGSGLHDKYKK